MWPQWWIDGIFLMPSKTVQLIKSNSKCSSRFVNLKQSIGISIEKQIEEDKKSTTLNGRTKKRTNASMLFDINWNTCIYRIFFNKMRFQTNIATVIWMTLLKCVNYEMYNSIVILFQTPVNMILVLFYSSRWTFNEFNLNWLNWGQIYANFLFEKSSFKMCLPPLPSKIVRNLYQLIIEIVILVENDLNNSILNR